jgi:diguanylate cyclase (GGDEF)-like protein/PAS domain S-box-containing protein
MAGGLFSGSGGFIPHGYCLAWNPLLVSAEVGADALIALSYFSIPLALMVFIRRNPSLHFNWVFVMFSTFIFACGTGHLLDIINLWTPIYRLEISVRVITATASVLTAMMLWPMLPKATALLRFNAAAGESLRRINEELQRSHDALAESHERFRLTLQNAPIGLAIVGLDGRFKNVNPALHEMLGYSERELLGMTFQDLTHPDDLAQDIAYIEQMLCGERDRYRMQKRYFHRFGHIVYIQLDVSVLRGVDGQPVHFISQIQDITSRVERENALQQSALTDELTGLPNRRAFLDEAARLLTRVRRTGEPISLLMIDIDRFKAINDTHGHASGDLVLCAMKTLVGPRLRGGDLLARLGGEEFGVLLPATAERAAQEIAERIRHAIADTEVRSLDGTPLALTASIGLAVVGGDESIHDALRRADQAMYRAKRNGRNRLVAAA